MCDCVYVFRATMLCMLVCSLTFSVNMSGTSFHMTTFSLLIYFLKVA